MNDDRGQETNCTTEYGRLFEKQSSDHALNGNWVVIFYPKHIASRGYGHDLLMYK